MSTHPRMSQREIDAELSRDGTVTDDASEGYLAEFAFGCETVVKLHGDETDKDDKFGIITGYEDPRPGSPPSKRKGRFIVDLARRTGSPGWLETGETVKLARHEFTVWGPADRDPGDREIDASPDGWETLSKTPGRRIYAQYDTAGDTITLDMPLSVARALADAFSYGVGALDIKLDEDGYGPYGHNDVDLLSEVLEEITNEEIADTVNPVVVVRDLASCGKSRNTAQAALCMPLLPQLKSRGLGEATPFLYALADLVDHDQSDTGEPAFDVRLDVAVDDEKTRSRGHRDKTEFSVRKYRILVKPTMQPLLQDEMEKVFQIADRYELAAWHQNVGLEITRSGDVPHEG